jgi:ABC-type lipoprotein release transport system permease subunit
VLALAWRNIWRQTRRSLITIMAMAFGAAVCMPMMSFMDGMFATMFDVAVTQQAGHIRVEHPDYPTTNSMFDTMEDAEQKLTSLEALPDASAVTWRAHGAGLLGTDKKSTGAVLVGVDPVREAKITPTSTMLTSGEWLNKPGQILLGYGLAEELSATNGSEVVIMTQASDGSIGAGTYTVTGLVRSGNAMRDKQGAWLSLNDLQELLFIENQVHELVLLAKGGRDQVDTLKTEVQSTVGDEVLVRSWYEADPQIAEMLKLGQQQSSVMLVIVFFLAGFGVLNTMLMSVFERTRELGVMMALGTRPRDVIRLVLMEGFLLSVMGAILGGVMGGGLTYLLCTHGIDLGYGDFEMSGVVFPNSMKGIFHINHATSVIGSMMVISVLAALWPAWRASRLEPVEAMRAD